MTCRATHARPHGQRSSWLRMAIGVIAATALVSGCAAGQISQTAQQVAAIDGANATVGAISVLNVHFATPEKATPSAVAYPASATATLVLTVSNAGLEADRLVAVSSPVGRFALASPVTVQASSGVELAHENAISVSLAEDLKYGISVPVTFSFDHAGTLTTNVLVANPQERDKNRPTVNIQPPHPTNLWQPADAEH